MKKANRKRRNEIIEKKVYFRQARDVGIQALYSVFLMSRVVVATIAGDRLYAVG